MLVVLSVGKLFGVVGFQSVPGHVRYCKFHVEYL